MAVASSSSSEEEGSRVYSSEDGMMADDEDSTFAFGEDSRNRSLLSTDSEGPTILFDNNDARIGRTSKHALSRPGTGCEPGCWLRNIL